MILDSSLLFSQAQALTTSAASTNVIDLLNARDVGIGEPTRLLVQVTAAFAGGTSLQAQFQGSPDNTTWSTYAEGPVINLAQLTVGRRLLQIQTPGAIFPADTPGNFPRYLRMNYLIVGTMTAGSVTSTIVLDRQDYKEYPKNFTVNN